MTEEKTQIQQPEGFPYHSIPVDEVFSLLETSMQGLTAEEAAKRFVEHGPNELTPPIKPSFLMKLWEQINNTIVYILIVAAVICGILREWAEFGLILAALIINVVIGLIQEAKSEKATEALKAMLASGCTVIRDGKRLVIDAKDLVPGDLIFFTSGDRIAADVRIVKASNLTIQEAILTGESVPVSKNIEPVEAKAALGDRTCTAYSATLVISGQGYGVVVETGDNAQIGRINTMVREVKEKPTALQIQLEIFGRYITLITAIIAIASFFLAWQRSKETVSDSFKSAASITVAIIPEGLPAVVTVTMALGVSAMARKKAIVRKLPAVETLGSVTVICSDKTGTLTKNEMTAVGVRTANTQYKVSGVGYEPVGTLTTMEDGPVADSEMEEMKELLITGILANDGGVILKDNQWTITGDPTDAAPLVLARKLGIPAEEELREKIPRLAVVPFESEHKWMATLHHFEDPKTKKEGRILHLKGAPERILNMCKYQLATNDFHGEHVPVDLDFWHHEVAEFSKQGLRVLALARYVVPDDFDAEKNMNVKGVQALGAEMTILCLIAIMDPPRPEVMDSIRDCHRAGITVKMITGDHPATARAIGAQLGITTDDGEVLIGSEIDSMSDAEFSKAVERCNIFARVSPENKIRVVTTLQENGHIASMTGDGVNDAPALKAASIGVAMGITGTEVSKEASKIVLADDNFATIVHAVEEGRRVWDNLRKIIIFTLPTNFAQGLCVFFAYVLGIENTPLTAVQVLYVNMITSVSISVSYSFEPPEEGSMSRPPRRPSKPLIGKHIVWRIFWFSLTLVVLIIGLFQWSLNEGHSVDRARTSGFSVIIFGSIFYGIACRKMRVSTVNMNTFVGNNKFWFSFTLVLVLQLMIIYIPGLNTFFSCEHIRGIEWLRIIGFSFALYIIVEVEKKISPYIFNPIIKPAFRFLFSWMPKSLSFPKKEEDTEDFHFIAMSASTMGYPISRQNSQAITRRVSRRISQRFEGPAIAEKHEQMKKQKRFGLKKPSILSPKKAKKSNESAKDSTKDSAKDSVESISVQIE